MNTIQKSIRRPLKSVSLMYWLNLPTEKTGEKNKQWNEGNNRKKLIVYETKQGELLLIEGYEKYFYLLKKNPYTIATFMIGDFESNLEARYAAVRELFTYQHSAWVTKMQQIRILHYTFKQEKNSLSSKLGIPLRTVEQYLIDEKVPLKIRAKAAEYDQAKLTNAICRFDMSDRFKQIMYEFVTYPSDHNLRLTDESWELARTMIRANWKSLLNLSDRNIRFLIVRHAIEFRKRSLENFTSEIDQIKNKAPTKLFERKYLLGEEKSKKDERLLQTIPY